MSTTLAAYRRTVVAEWTRLAHLRTTLTATLLASGLGSLLTWAIIATATNRRSDGPTSTTALQQGTGMTAPTSAAASYLFMLIFAVFAAMSAGGYAHGTTRAALLRQPRRLTLAAGELTARYAYVSLILITAQLIAIALSFPLAHAYHLSTAAWTTTTAVTHAVAAIGRMEVFILGWAILATSLGVLTRSVITALSIGLLWAGPFENIVGDKLDAGPRWFPGLLLRAALTGNSPTTQTHVFTVLTAYGLLATAATAWALTHRDITH